MSMNVDLVQLGARQPRLLSSYRKCLNAANPASERIRHRLLTPAEIPRNQAGACQAFDSGSSPLLVMHHSPAVEFLHTKVKMASPSKRREMDVMKLMMSDYEVTMCDDDSVSDFDVIFHGPKDTNYEGGVWKIHCELPEAYPYKSPSIGFVNRIFHPNVDETSGSVCLDVINQTWSPMFDLINVFEVFLPQLLAYPNPTDPLNGEAAALLMREPDRYSSKVKEYVQKYARMDVVKSLGNKEEKSESEPESDLSSYSNDDANMSD